jgi:hypothetical protein
VAAPWVDRARGDPSRGFVVNHRAVEAPATRLARSSRLSPAFVGNFLPRRTSHAFTARHMPRRQSHASPHVTCFGAGHMPCRSSPASPLVTCLAARHMPRRPSPASPLVACLAARHIPRFPSPAFAARHMPSPPVTCPRRTSEAATSSSPAGT